MADKPDSDEESIVARDGGFDETLTPDARETLTDLALMSERHVELSATLGDARRTMASMLQRHPAFEACSSELHAKMTELERLLVELGSGVMRHSLAYERALELSLGSGLDGNTD